MTYSRVNGEAPPGKATLRPVDDGVEAFLGEHVTKLLDLAEKDDTPRAGFHEEAMRDHFANLADGDDAAFLAAASTLTTRVHERMDGRATPGLLLCATLEHEGTNVAAVMKLSVVAEQGAILELLESGEEVLSAVTDVLERPGDLQKGVIIPDTRAGSDAVLGDKLGAVSLYFPEALGLRQEERGSQALAALLRAIAAHDPTAAEAAAERMQEVTAQTVEGVLAQLGNYIPALTADVQAEVAGSLREKARPVVAIDPQRPVSGVITAGTLKITGPFASVRGIEWIRDPESDDWIITARVDAPPERKFK